MCTSVKRGGSLFHCHFQTTFTYYGRNYSVTGFVVVLERSVYPFLLNIYHPTFLVVLASFISFFIPVNVVPGRIGLLITTFLVLINVSNESVNTAPGTSSFTAMGAWLMGKLSTKS